MDSYLEKVAFEVGLNVDYIQDLTKRTRVVAMVGDKEVDMPKGKNTISFPQIGTDAQIYCEQNGIPHVPVKSAVDYSLVLATILADFHKHSPVTEVIPVRVRNGE